MTKGDSMGTSTKQPESKLIQLRPHHWIKM